MIVCIVMELLSLGTTFPPFTQSVSSVCAWNSIALAYILWEQIRGICNIAGGEETVSIVGTARSHVSSISCWLSSPFECSNNSMQEHCWVQQASVHRCANEGGLLAQHVSPPAVVTACPPTMLLGGMPCTWHCLEGISVLAAQQCCRVLANLC